MFDHRAPPESARREVLLDEWLDGLNEPGDHAPPPAPSEIAALAAVAGRYHDALGMAAGETNGRPKTTREGSMTHFPFSTAFPGKRGATPSPATGNHPARIASLTRGLAGALVMILLIVLAAGPILREYGWPGGLADRFSLLAPEEESLACASPGFRPLIEGEGTAESLAALAALTAIGFTEAPIQIGGGEVSIPTSTGEIVTLPTTSTSLGGPIWANTIVQNGRTVVRNIETGKEWTVPTSGLLTSGGYEAPYLFLPTSSAQNDWRIIDTTTGAERLVSDIRGEPFPVQVDLSPIGYDWDQRPAPSGTAVWLFSSYSEPVAGGEPPELGPNALVLPPSLAEAEFLPDTVDATYFHETVYSTATQRLAFATGAGTDRAIVVIEPGSGARIVVRDERFTDQALPLTFSADGSSLIVDQSNAIFLVSLDGEPSVMLVHEAERAFVPIAHDPASMRVLIMFRDRTTAIVDAASGTTTNVPGITVPESPPAYGTFDPLFRMSSNTRLFEMYDDETSTIRFIDLATGAVSAATAVLNPAADVTDEPTQPEFQYVIPYPHVARGDFHAFLDERGALRVVSATSDESFSLPAPDDFAVGANQVVDLLISPNDGCVILNLRDASGSIIIRDGERIDGATTSWVAPLEPDAAWTRLDIALVGWREVYQPPAGARRASPDIASPVATPGQHGREHAGRSPTLPRSSRRQPANHVRKQSCPGKRPKTPERATNSTAHERRTTSPATWPATAPTATTTTRSRPNPAADHPRPPIRPALHHPAQLRRARRCLPADRLLRRIGHAPQVVPQPGRQFGGRGSDPGRALPRHGPHRRPGRKGTPLARDGEPHAVL